LPPGTFDDSVEAAGHLVRMAGVWVLVDGYNVTKSARPELTLVDQRQWLADAAVELAARTGARIELVFDGADERASAPADLGRRLGVQLRFSAEGIEADDVLLDLVEKLPQGLPVVVASDDRRVREGARQRGANVLTTAQLLTVLGRPLS
jgi:predicted RNA-binding protein with PIN domain